MELRCHSSFHHWTLSYLLWTVCTIRKYTFSYLFPEVCKFFSVYRILEADVFKNNCSLHWNILWGDVWSSEKPMIWYFLIMKSFHVSCWPVAEGGIGKVHDVKMCLSNRNAWSRFCHVSLLSILPGDSVLLYVN